MGKYEALAKDIVKNIGGKENISSLSHCITRLRFVVKDASKVNEDVLKNMDGVVTLMKSGGQHQVVIGNHVGQVYEDVVKVAGIQEAGSGEEEAEIEGLFNKFIDVMSKVFQPILGTLSASGIIKGLSALLAFMIPAYVGSGAQMFLNAIGDAIFHFLPVVVGYTAARRFKVNPVTGITIGGALMYPALQASTLGAGELMGHIPYLGDYYNTFLGIPFVPQNYAGSVLPVLIIVAFASIIEKQAKKRLPAVFQGFFVPFFTLMIALPVGLLAIGPVMSALTNLLMDFFKMLIGFSPVLFGAVLGFFWQVLVIFGLHWAVIPLGIVAIQAQGMDRIMVGFFGASFAQTAALAAMTLKMKDKKKRALAVPGIISGIFGVTEPAIYGYTLPAKKPFLYSMIGGAVSGALFMMLGGTRYRTGGLGVFGIMNYISDSGEGLLGVLVCIISATLIGFLLTYFFWKEEAEAEEAPVAKGEKDSLVQKAEDIYAPMAGEIIDLEEVQDEAFASKALGDGVAIRPTDGKVYSPVDGTIGAFFKTKHAIGITSDAGVEVLIHIGMDTVNMEGRGFVGHVEQGDKVKKGDLLIEVDLDLIKEEGYPTDTPIIITNSADLLDLIKTDKKEVGHDDKLMTALF